MNKTAKAFATMGKIIGGVRYVPESEMKALEQESNRLRQLCKDMTEDVQSLTDDDIASIAERHAKDIKGMAAYIKFLIGLYHKEKSVAATWRLKFEQLEGKTDGQLG